MSQPLLWRSPIAAPQSGQGPSFMIEIGYSKSSVAMTELMARALLAVSSLAFDPLAKPRRAKLGSSTGCATVRRNALVNDVHRLHGFPRELCRWVISSKARLRLRERRCGIRYFQTSAPPQAALVGLLIPAASGTNIGRCLVQPAWSLLPTPSCQLRANKREPVRQCS